MSTISALRPWLVRDRLRLVAAAGASLIGVLGLVTAVSGPARDRLQAVLTVLPALSPETARVTLVFISIALILMGRGLRHGSRAAWTITTGLLVATIVLHLLHGSAPAASIPAALAVAWLTTQSDTFNVMQNTTTVRRLIVIAGFGALASVLAATGLAAAFGGRFAAPALIVTGLCLMIGTLCSLLSPRRLRPANTEERTDESERARRSVADFGGDTLAYFALRDDKAWFFSGRSVVAYAVRAGVCVVSPDPIGPVEERSPVWAEFMSFAGDQGWSVSVLGADAAWLPTYEDSGLRPVYLGDEAIIACQEFTLDGRDMRNVRQAHSRVRRSGYTMRLHRGDHIDAELKSRLVELASLSRHGIVERGFSMTLSRLFDPRDTGLLVSVAYDGDGAAQAFIQWVPCDGGWSLDVMRRNTVPGLRNGVSDFLIVESLNAFAAQGATRVGLNFAVFRNIVSGGSTSWVGRTGRRLLRVSASSTQIESLWRFNMKFGPTWVPRYAVLGSLDVMATQSVVMAGAEGLNELPIVGRFMTGMTPC